MKKLAQIRDCKIICVNKILCRLLKTATLWGFIAEGICLKRSCYFTGKLLFTVLLKLEEVQVYKIRLNPVVLKGGYNEKTTQRCLLPGNR